MNMPYNFPIPKSPHISFFFFSFFLPQGIRLPGSALPLIIPVISKEEKVEELSLDDVM